MAAFLLHIYPRDWLYSRGGSHIGHTHIYACIYLLSTYIHTGSAARCFPFSASQASVTIFDQVKCLYIYILLYCKSHSIVYSLVRFLRTRSGWDSSAARPRRAQKTTRLTSHGAEGNTCEGGTAASACVAVWLIARGLDVSPAVKKQSAVKKPLQKKSGQLTAVSREKILILVVRKGNILDKYFWSGFSDRLNCSS